MSTNPLKKLGIAAAFAVGVGFCNTAFAADNSQAPWWQFWNQNNTPTPVASASPLPERITYDQQVLAQDKSQMQQTIQKFQNDRRAGLDTTADKQAIAAQRQTTQDHVGNLRYDAQAAGVPLQNNHNQYSGYERHDRNWNSQAAPYGPDRSRHHFWKPNGNGDFQYKRYSNQHRDYSN